LPNDNCYFECNLSSARLFLLPRGFSFTPLRSIVPPVRINGILQPFVKELVKRLRLFLKFRIASAVSAPFVVGMGKLRLLLPLSGPDFLFPGSVVGSLPGQIFLSYSLFKSPSPSEVQDLEQAFLLLL